MPAPPVESRTSAPLSAGLFALLVLLAVAVAGAGAYLVLRSVGSSPSASPSPAASPAPIPPSDLVLTTEDLPGYTTKPLGSPNPVTASTDESSFQSTAPPARVVVSLATVKDSDQQAATFFTSTRSDHLANGLHEQPAPPLGQRSTLLTNDQSIVLLWRHGRVVSQISASGSVTVSVVTTLGERQDARVRSAIGS